MPTTNPRVNVTLSPSLDALVRRMAQHQRSSKSQVLRELLEAAEPALQRAVALMDAASMAAKEVRDGLARNLDQAQSRAERSLAHVMAGIDQATEDLVSQAEAIRGRRPARRPQGGTPASSGGPNPPASNRGVKSRTRPEKTGDPHAPKVTRKGVKS